MRVDSLPSPFTKQKLVVGEGAVLAAVVCGPAELASFPGAIDNVGAYGPRGRFICNRNGLESDLEGCQGRSCCAGSSGPAS
jgi:hypothetical protein